MSIPRPGLAAAVHIAFADLGGARHHLVDLRREVILFLDAESAARNIDVVGRELIDRIVLAAFLERGLHAEDLAQGRDLLRLRDSADCGTRVRMKSITWLAISG